MNGSINSIVPWLEHLKVMMPPGAAALVGAGNGKGVWVQWLLQQLGQCNVSLFEADVQQFAILQRTLAASGHEQDCQLHNTVVAEQDGPTAFFTANSPLENGLLDPQSLQSLWPNLQTVEVTQQSAVTLDSLLGDLHEDVGVDKGGHIGHWLIIDCLPAASLLQASSAFAAVDVIIARVLLDSVVSAPEGSALKEVAQVLQGQGLVQVALEPSRHPAIGYALFVRDAYGAKHQQALLHRAECLKLRQAADEQTRLAQERQAQIEQLVQDKRIAAQQVQERLAQIQQLTKAKAAVENQSQERAQQLEHMGKARDEQSKLAQERQEQLERLSKACDEQAKLAQERQVQIEQLIQAKAVGEKHSQERAQQVEQLGKARDDQAKLARDRQAQIEQLSEAKSVAEKKEQYYKNKESIRFNELLVSLQEKIKIQKEIFYGGFIVNELVKQKKPPIYAKWPKKGPVKLNFGDRLNPIIIRFLSGRTVFNEALFSEKPTTYWVIGSAVKAATEFNSIIWGMGYISHADYPGKPGLVTAVRGPRTRKKMLDAGISCPEVYGDPALLLPYFYNPSVRENKGVALILHYREFNDEEIRSKYEALGFRLINLNGKLSSVINEIKASSIVISSSLHGLIMAHAYGVPVVWAKFSDLPLGDGFKFNDYLESMGFRGAKPVNSKGIISMNVDNMTFRVGKPLVDLEKLLANCPFISHESVLFLCEKIKNSSFLNPLLLTENFE